MDFAGNWHFDLTDEDVVGRDPFGVAPGIRELSRHEDPRGLGDPFSVGG